MTDADRLTGSSGADRPAPGGGRTSRRRWVAVGLAVVIVGAVALVLTRGGAPSVGRAREINSAVEVRSGGEKFVPVREHPEVKAGDVVRTNDSGMGEIDYGDGSKTRLDAKTSFTVDELLTSSQRVVRAKLTTGRVWNNVKKLTASQDRFEVRTPNAVATVRGTIFVCEAYPSTAGLFETTCMQVTGRTDVVFTNGATSSLSGGECTTNGGPCKYTPARLYAILSKFAELDGVTLPWKPKAKGELPEPAEESLVPSVGSDLPGGPDLPDPIEERTRRPSIAGDDDEDSDDDRDDREDRDDRGLDPRDDDSDTPDPDPGDDGDPDPGEEEEEEEESDGDNGCGDGIGGGQGGGCPHNGSDS